MGDTGNLMRAKRIPPLLSCGGRAVRHYLNDTHLYVIAKVANALKESTEKIKNIQYEDLTFKMRSEG